MILITTPTGNCGQYVLSELLSSQAPAPTPVPIRVFLRAARKLSPDHRAKCDVVEGDLKDAEALRRAATGVDSVFFCVPQSGTPANVADYYRSFYEVAAPVFKECGVKRLVLISGGRGEPKDVGPSGPLAEMEQAFDATGIHTRHIRCGLFMEGIFYWVPQLKFTKTFSLPLAGDYKIAMVAAKDIGRTAATLLLDTTWTGHEGVSTRFYDSLSPDEMAAIFSSVLGQTILFKPVTGEEFKKNLIKYGVSAAMAQALVEMYEDIDNGSLNGSRPSESTDGVRLLEWANEKLIPRMTWFAVIKSVLFG